ncbi:iron transporter [Gordonia sp. TBRC 11910]|uniref:Iron transporter n=1 Tax=Gordonia asplenii TaxID=2725283 RepID=A0A848KZH5_9ACTN|nr:iron uptake transporter permease EfeU [Gordonia asplenii]NMO03986.1 iron transporter [Gordonia asplenii]
METLAAASGPTVFAQLFGSALIGVREGLETGIVVMILVAFLVKSGRRDALKWVWLGVGLALAMVVGTFAIIHYGTSTIDGLTAELIAGLASLVAVVIVTFMVLWMSKAAAHISGDLKEGMSKALVAGAPAVLALSFLAVGREGFETALLMVGYAESVSGGMWPLVGLLIGVLVAVGLTVALYFGAVRINFAKFFRYTGVFLIFVAAGILAYGVRALQTYGWLPGISNTAFDWSSWYDLSSWYGTVLGGVFNIHPNPTWLQVIAWAAYLIIVLAAFLRRTASTPTAKASEPSVAQENSASTTTHDAVAAKGKETPTP